MAETARIFKSFKFQSQIQIQRTQIIEYEEIQFQARFLTVF